MERGAIYMECELLSSGRVCFALAQSEELAIKGSWWACNATKRIYISWTCTGEAASYLHSKPDQVPQVNARSPF